MFSPSFPPGKLDDDEDAVGMLLDAGALQGLGGERYGRAAQDERSPAPTRSRRVLREKVTPRARHPRCFLSVYRSLSANGGYGGNGLTGATE